MATWGPENQNFMTHLTFGHWPFFFFFFFFGGGGLNAYPDGLGHLFREELSMVKWAFAHFWGV